MNILKAQHYGFSLLSFLSACVCVQTVPQSRNIPLQKVPCLKLYVVSCGGRCFTWYVIFANSHITSIQSVRVRVGVIPSGRLHLNPLLRAKFPGIFPF